CNWNILDTV
uniref:Uncharacterized protein n=1 Tax=Callorhinchus milii TaxID=7868 RepID=A0A4W3K3Q8_CALMI